jgi:GNAT superfamily N-acetyltransferase
MIEHLEKDMLSNITLLKMIECCADRIQSVVIEEERQWGVLLLLPAQSFLYDQRTYPDADYVVMMDYSSDDLFPRLMSYMPSEANLVFKLQKEKYRSRLSELYPLQKARSFHSYTSPGEERFFLDADVVISDMVDDRLLPLWSNNGYDRAEIEHYFANGASSFTVYREESPASTCLVFRNYKHVWEIGAVHTLEKWRGGGLAKKAVAAAVHWLASRGLTPRYQVLETNVPSMKLAESAGLVRFVTLDHFKVTGRFHVTSKREV